MCTRRTFLRRAASGAVAVRGVVASASPPEFSGEFSSRRPPLEHRKFSSEVVEAKIAEVKRAISDRELAWLFENCFPNTLDTTVRVGELDGRPDTFVITGDIPAMWLRDSAAQVWPYLQLANLDPKLKSLLAGVVNRQTRCILTDPYANAFYYGPMGGKWAGDLTEMQPGLHERKWEIDSLCYAIRLAHGYWKATGDGSCFDASWRQASVLILNTFRAQQRMGGRGPYSFQRVTASPTDSLPLKGFGNPTHPCGLIHSGFRPSDDACIYPFLIPSNLFAAVSLRQLGEIYRSGLSDAAFARDCEALADEIRGAVDVFAKTSHGRYSRIYAYEVDGFGNQLFMDDANIPNLISLPYLGCCASDDPVYRNTRRFVLSGDNPYFFSGSAAEGVGGPHVGLGMIWPLGIVMRGLTSRSDTEIAHCLAMLKATHGGSGFMHESFSAADPAKFTRAWFAWANTLFGEFIGKVHAKHPRLLRSAS